MKYDVITFGSASQDLYLLSKKFLPPKKRAPENGGSCVISLPFAEKIEMDDVLFFSGGGGTNAAATFAKQGFKAAFCGKIGDDCPASLILKELKRLKIDTDLITKTKDKPTNVSVILSYPGADKTVLVYRGASDILEKKDIPWLKLKESRWFYLAPFSGQLANLTEELINFAKKNKIKVALNPGYTQLTFSMEKVKRILEKIDILILNQEEASMLTKTPARKEKEIFKKLDKLTPGICIMTKGNKGVRVSDGKNIYRARGFGVKVIDATGAGDSFGAGFVAGFIKRNNVTDAIQLGMANAALNLSKWGAKEGLLGKNRKFKKIKVIKEKH